MHPDFKDHSVQNLTNVGQRQLLIPNIYYYWKISAFKTLSCKFCKCAESPTLLDSAKGIRRKRDGKETADVLRHRWERRQDG